ncbi:hypothetical protein COCOBI_04-3700 [Coccomyxa sp. Obi]|nr:hypothetical protein COCOBI_04-3700 [Coccomyxa sp. Obi]
MSLACPKVAKEDGVCDPAVNIDYILYRISLACGPNCSAPTSHIFPGSQGTGLADKRVCLLALESRTEQDEADLRELDELPKLRKRLAVETKVFCDSNHPLSRKAEQPGFRRVELMQPHLIRGKELPRDLEDWGKRMLAWVCLSVHVERLEQLKKDIKTQARRRASKSSMHSGMWSDVRAVGKKTWGLFFS